MAARRSILWERGHAGEVRFVETRKAGEGDARDWEISVLALPLHELVTRRGLRNYSHAQLVDWKIRR